MNLIQTIEQEEVARLGKNIPEFAPGDTVIRYSARFVGDSPGCGEG